VCEFISQIQTILHQEYWKFPEQSPNYIHVNNVFRIHIAFQSIFQMNWKVTRKNSHENSHRILRISGTNKESIKNTFMPYKKDSNFLIFVDGLVVHLYMFDIFEKKQV